jgi:hypothetical protein
MDAAEHQRMVERRWVIERLRQEARARAAQASRRAAQASDRARVSHDEAADLHDDVARLADEVAELYGKLGEDERAKEHRRAADSARDNANAERRRRDTAP